MTEKIQTIEAAKLIPYPNNPFRLRELGELQDSISEVGVVAPLIVRTRADGELEILDGHRRHMAAQMAGIDKLPVIVRNLDDDAAAIVLVDSNIARPSLLPSERGRAYRLKYEVLRHQGQACGTEFHKSRDAIDETITGRQVANYIRLTELIEPLLEKVDASEIALKPAVELSYLPARAQKWVAEQCDIQKATPSHAQTRRLRALHEQGQLTEGEVMRVMAEDKPNQVETIRLPMDRFKPYFPKQYTPKQIEDKLIELLKQWRRRERQRANRSAR